MMLGLILLIAAVVLFGLAAFNVRSPARFGWLAGGLFAWALSTLFLSVRL